MSFFIGACFGGLFGAIITGWESIWTIIIFAILGGLLGYVQGVVTDEEVRHKENVEKLLKDIKENGKNEEIK